jgi:hypothetical protein
MASIISLDQGAGKYASGMTIDARRDQGGDGRKRLGQERRNLPFSHAKPCVLIRFFIRSGYRALC